MDTKFCTACQVTRPAEGGVKKKAGRIVRWVCRMCVEKRSSSHFGKPKE